MEMLVLEKIRWELASPNAFQFLEIILANLENILTNKVLSVVQKHASTFLALAATEYRFYNVKPSVLVSRKIYLVLKRCIFSTRNILNIHYRPTTTTVGPSN